VLSRVIKRQFKKAIEWLNNSSQMAELSIPLNVLSTNNGFISGFLEIPGPQNTNNQM
jgi:hypothetical protein